MVENGPSKKAIKRSMKFWGRNGCANFMGAWHFWFFLLENPHAHKIPPFRGGVLGFLRRKTEVKDRIANCYCRNLFWASGALSIHDCMPEDKQKQPQNRKTIFETLSLPVAKILSPVARQAPTPCACALKGSPSTFSEAISKNNLARHPKNLFGLLFQEVSRRGWRTERVGVRKSFLCHRFRPLFCTLFPIPPYEKGDTILGPSFFLYFGPC